MFILCCLVLLAPGQGGPDSRLTIDERVFTASRVYSLRQLYFSSAEETSDPSLDVSYKTYLNAAPTTDDRRQFDLATIEFVAQLHNGHTFFWDAWLDKDNQQPLGFYAAPLDGYWVVQTSFLAGLKPGDVIVRIDNTPAEAFFQQQQRYNRRSRGDHTKRRAYQQREFQDYSVGRRPAQARVCDANWRNST